MTDIKDILRNELEARCQKNGSYSLRAFARFLEIDAPTLSKILNDQKQPGKKLTKRLSDRIGLQPSIQEKLVRQNTSLKEMPKPKANEYQLLENDQFHIICHWYYYAIFEVLELEGAIHTPEWIAKKLGLRLSVVKTALHRLLRAGLIKKQGEKWADTTDGRVTVIGKELTTSARRAHQKEILQKAMDALENISIELRDQTSMTLAIDREEVPKVKELITEFRRKLSRHLSQSKQKNEVYNLAISFYPVTQQNEANT